MLCTFRAADTHKQVCHQKIAVIPIHKRMPICYGRNNHRATVPGGYVKGKGKGHPATGRGGPTGDG